MPTTLYIRNDTGTSGERLAWQWGMESPAAPPQFSPKEAARSVSPGATDYSHSIATHMYWLSTTIGSFGLADSSATVNGPTDGVMMGHSSAGTGPTGHEVLSVSSPLAADVTISGTINFDIWASESSMNANLTIRVVLYRMDETGAFTQIVDSSFGTELTTTEALKSWTASPTSTLVKKGHRIAMLIIGDDATAVNMATGFTWSVYLNGGSGTRDSRITFTETITFVTTDPTGTALYLRAAASGVGSESLSETQGSSPTTARYATVNGPVTPYPGNQMTKTGGGSVVEWHSFQVAGFTLSGVVLAMLGNEGSPFENYSTSFGRSMIPEIAITDNDGTNAVVWSRGYANPASGIDDIFAYRLSGPDLVVADGKRIRFRMYFDDPYPGVNQASGVINIDLGYDGSGVDASRLIFTQTITAFTPPARWVPPYTTPQAVTRSHSW